MAAVSLMDIGLWVLVGLVVGWLAALIDQASDESVLRDVTLGVLGGCIGGLATDYLPVTSRSPVLLSIATATIGAASLLALARAITTARWTR